MQLARRIKRWCGQAAYDEWKRSGNLPADLPTPEEVRELTKASAKKAAKERFVNDPESVRASRRVANLTPKQLQDKRKRSRQTQQKLYYSDLDQSRRLGRKNRLIRFHREERNADKDALEYGCIVAQDPCSYCSSPVGGVREHIQAVSRGGDGSFMNLTGSCASCNGSKQTKSLLTFLLHKKDLHA